jgi:hypothetical protein
MVQDFTDMPSRSTVQAAMGGLAADMGAGHLQIFTDEMHQQRAWFDEAFDLGAVHLHGHMGLCHFVPPLKA